MVGGGLAGLKLVAGGVIIGTVDEDGAGMGVDCSGGLSESRTWSASLPGGGPSGGAALPRPPMIDSASILTVTDAAAPTTHAVAPADIRRTVERT
jgi:hypothetical protein